MQQTETQIFMELIRQNQMQHLATIDHDRPLEEAVNFMLSKDYSQLPVQKKKKIIGVITHQSVAKTLTNFKENKPKTGKLTVKDFMEPIPKFFTPQDPLFDLLDALSQKNYILIQNNRETRIITAYDALQIFKQTQKQKITQQ